MMAGSMLAERDSRNRAREWFHSLTVPAGVWPVIRVDGRGFSKLTEAHYTKPVDDTFAHIMVETAKTLVTEFDAVYGYTESDEISILLPREFDMFGRSVEKIVSLSAAVASSTFSLHAGSAASFDSRIWMGASPVDVGDYFQWRQSDAARAALNNYCYWTLRHDGHSARAATSVLSSASRSEKNELLFQYGINFNTVETWHKRGIGIHWETYNHVGVDPRTQTSIPTTRRRLAVEESLLLGQDYTEWLARILAESETKG